MKRYFTLVCYTLIINGLQAQITVTTNDFASAGDAVIMSNADINQLLNYKYAGPDTTWDFSTLQYSSQYVDNFMNELSVLEYALYFSDISYNSHRANIAENGSAPAPVLPLLPLTITNAVNYYYNSSSQYEQPGFGADINGIPLPIEYNSNDIIYNFPLQYGDTVNSSASGYDIDLLSSGYYAYQQTRTNTVDGWGTLTTPFGTFPVIRMVSEISADDSFYITGINYGIKIPRFTQKQYKWIANGQQEPVLQINTTVIVNNIIEDVTSIVYRDSLHPVVVVNTAIDEPATSKFSFNVFPNPAGGQFNILTQNDVKQASFVISDITGRTVMNAGMEGNQKIIETSGWARGIYFVILSQNGQKMVRRVVLE